MDSTLRLRLFLTVLAVASYASCNELDVTAVDAASVQVTPAQETVRVGEVRQFRARVADAGGNELRGRGVTWTMSDGAVASVDDEGRVTGLVPGETRVLARVEGASGEAAIIVLSKPVATVEVQPASPSIPHDGSVQLQVTLRAADGSTVTGPAIGFASDDPSIASVSGTGLVQAVGEGTTRISATAEGRSGQATVIVEPPPAASIEIQPPVANIAVSATATLNAIVKAADGRIIRGHVVNWISDAPGVVAVNGAGVISGVAVGGANITATAGGLSAQARVTVTAQRVARLDLQPPTATTFVGGSLQLEARAFADDGSELPGRPVDFRSMAPQIATVDALGRVVGLVQGSTQVIATAEGMSDTTTVFVVNQPVFAVAVVPASASVVVGGTVDLDAVLTATDGTVLSRPTTWASDNAGIATVDNSGVVTGVSSGTATITATSEGKSGSAAVTVSPKPVAQVVLAPATPSLFVGDAVQIRATLTAADGSVLTGRQIAWTTSAAGVATVDNAGNVIAVGAGTATITATAEGIGGTATVTVTSKPVATVTVTPPDTTLFTGQTAALTVQLRAADGTVLTGRTVTWSSAAPAVASVNPATGATTTGTAVAAGLATITATAEGVSGTANVRVLARVATVTVTPATARLAPGSVQPFQAVLRSAGGAVLTGRTVTWRTSDANVFALGATTGDVVNGTAGAGAGSATITASAEGIDGTAAVTVALNVGSVTITPNPPPDLLPGQSTQLTATVRAADGTVLTDRPVIWVADPTLLSIATTGAMNDRATVTAVAAACVGALCSTTVTASADNMTTQVVVNVLKPVATIDIAPATPPQLDAGATFALTATLRAADGTVLSNRPLTWSSLAPTVATVNPATGLVTAAANPACAAGTQTCTVAIRATATNAPASAADDVTRDVTIDVRKRVASVTVAPPGATIVEGGTQLFTATVRASDGTVLTNRVISWSSAPATVAGVNPTTGATTTAFTTGPGTATITATAEGVSGSGQLDVSPRVASVTVLPSSAALAPGGTQDFTVELRAANGVLITGRTVTWQTSNPNVFGLSSTSNTGASGTAIADGTATITATAEGVSGNATVTVTTPVASVTVTPNPANLAPGAPQMFTAELRDASNNILTGRTITWTSSNVPVFTLTSNTGPSVSGTAGTDGTSTITATAEGVSGTATVTVVTSVASVTVTPNTANLAPGAPQMFTAEPRSANGTLLTGRTITWTSSNDPVFNLTSNTGPSVSGTAGTDGSSTITATAEGVSGTATVTVVTPVASVTVTPNPANLAPGAPQMFTAEPRSADGTLLTGRTITWTSSNAAVFTLASNTGPSVSGTAGTDGSSTITATAEGVSGNATVTVVTPVASVTVLPATADLAPGAQQAFTAEPHSANGTLLTGRTITWTSSNDPVFTLTSNTGPSVSGTAGTDGSSTITATAEGVSGTATVTVTTPAAPVASVTVTPNPANLAPGAPQMFTAELRDASNNILTGRTITWTSSDVSVFPLASNTGPSVSGTAGTDGSSTITATAEGVSGTATVVVTTPPAPVASVTVTPNPANLAPGAPQTFTAELRDASNNILTGRTITWTSSDVSVFPLTSNTGPSVSGTAGTDGTSTITATAEGVSGTATVTVTTPPAPVATIVIMPSTATLSPGGGQSFTAELFDAGGNKLIGRTVTWTTTDASIFALTTNSGETIGGIAGSVTGTATVTATSEGIDGTAVVTVQ